MSLKKSITALSLILTTGVVSAYDIRLKRCETWGDTINGEQAIQRWAWAKRCDPAIQFVASNMPDLLPPVTAIDEKGRNRRTYPVYGVPRVPTKKDDFPWFNPKKYFAPVSAKAVCNIPSGYKIAFLCLGGCYTPDQMIEFSSGKQAIVDAKMNDEKQIMSYQMTEDEQFTSEKKPIEYFTDSSIEGEHTVLTFTAENGKNITVTEEHPLIDGMGRVRTARSFNEEDSLMTPDGAVLITSIEKKKYFGKVYNLSIATKNPGEKVLNAQGFLNADVTYQNENDILLGKMIFRLTGISDSDVN